MRSLTSDSAFMCVDELKERLMKHCIKYITSKDVQFGYIIPGHGKKGSELQSIILKSYKTCTEHIREEMKLYYG